MGSVISRLRFLLKDTIFYGVAGALLRFFALITTPILTRTLMTADFGVVDSVTVLLGIVLGLSLLGQDSAVARYYYATDDADQRRQIAATGFWISTLGSCLAAAFIFLAAKPISRGWLGLENADAVLQIMALVLPLSVMVQHFMALLKWTFRRVRFAFLACSIALLNLGGILILVVRFRFGATGALWAQALAQGGGVLLGIIFCRDLLGFTFVKLQASRLLAFGWPYMIIWAGSMLQVGLDRMFVAQQLSTEQLGFYAAGVKVAALMGLVISGFQIAWGPFAFSLFKEPDASQTFCTVLLLYTAALLILAVVLSTFSAPIVSLLASARYREGQAVVGLLALASAIGGILWIVCIGLVVAERPALTALGHVSGLMVGGLLLYPVLVPRFSLLGASLGTLGMQAMTTGLVARFAQQVHPYPYDFRRLCMMIGVAAVCIGGQTLLPAPSNRFEWCSRTGVGLLAIGMIAALLASQYAPNLHWRNWRELLATRFT